MSEAEEKYLTAAELPDVYPQSLSGMLVMVDLRMPANWVLERLLGYLKDFRASTQHREHAPHGVTLRFKDHPVSMTDRLVIEIIGERLDYLGAVKPLGFVPMGIVLDRRDVDQEQPGVLITAWLSAFPELLDWFTGLLSNPVTGRKEWVNLIEVEAHHAKLDTDFDWTAAARQLHKELQNCLLKQPRVRKRGPNVGTLPSVAKAKLFMQRWELNKRAACKQALVDPKTFDKYKDHPDIPELMAELEQDQEFRKLLEGT